MSFNNTTTYLNCTDLYSSPISDFTNVFIIPLVSFIGALLSLTSIIVIAKSELKGDLYNIMLISSIFNFVYLLIVFMNIIARCGSYCAISYNQSTKIYEQYVYLFIGNTILLSEFLLDFIFSLYRLISFSSKFNSSRLHKISTSAKFIFIVVLSVLANIPLFLTGRIIKKFTCTKYENSEAKLDTIYSIVINEIDDSFIMSDFLLVISVVRGPLLFVLLFLINLLIGYKFSKFIRNKKNVIRPLNSLGGKYIFFS